MKLTNAQTGYTRIPLHPDYFFTHNMTLYYTPYMWNYLQNFERYNIENDSQMCLSFKDCTEKVSKNQNTFTVLPKVLVDYQKFVNKDSPVKDLGCVSGQHEWQIPLSLSFLFRKNHPVINVVNRKLLDIVDSGVSQVLKRKFITFPLQESGTVVIGKPINIQNLIPSFYFVLGEELIAVLIFAVEWLIYLFKK